MAIKGKYPNGLARAIEQSGVSKSELARRLETSRQQVQRYVDGEYRLDKAWAEAFSEALGCPASDLVFGTDEYQVPIVGLAGASTEGGVAYAETDGELGTANRPANGTDKTVALEVRGDSLRGVAEDGWLIFYDEIRNPPTPDLFGLPCVVGLEDGRVLVKYLKPTASPHVFHLISTNADPMFDEIVAWAARVISIEPRRPARVGAVKAVA